MNDFEKLETALLIYREALRKAGLPHLASQMAVGPIQTPDDFLAAHRRVAIIHTLLTIRPPPAWIYARFWKEQHHVDELVARLEKRMRTQSA